MTTFLARVVVPHENPGPVVFDSRSACVTRPTSEARCDVFTYNFFMLQVGIWDNKEARVASCLDTRCLYQLKLLSVKRTLRIVFLQYIWHIHRVLSAYPVCDFPEYIVCQRSEVRVGVTRIAVIVAPSPYDAIQRHTLRLQRCVVGPFVGSHCNLLFEAFCGTLWHQDFCRLDPCRSHTSHHFEA